MSDARLLRRPFIDRFWDKVDRRGPEDCWPWKGFRNKAGYGSIATEPGKGPMLAHRAAYVFGHGPIPDGKFVCHHCDHPWCCNPAHLFAGDNADNLGDMRRKGRAARGERAAPAKLTEAAVRAIRARASRGTVSPVAVGREFGVTESTIRKVLAGASWAHVK